MTKLQQQCAERKRQRQDVQIVNRLIKQFDKVPRNVRLKRAMARLPSNASQELRRQVTMEVLRG